MGRRTDGGRFDHVADGESLDCLVLGSASRAVAAANRLDVAAALLVTAAVVLLALPPSFDIRRCILGRSLFDHDGLILIFRKRMLSLTKRAGCAPKMWKPRSQRWGLSWKFVRTVSPSLEVEIRLLWAKRGWVRDPI